MKFFHWTMIFLLLACLFATADAQVKKAKVSTQAKGKTCQTNQFLFPCPKGLQVKRDAQTDVFVGYFAAKKFGVFAFAPDKTLSESELSDEALKAALQNLYSTKLEDYQWKASDDFYDDSKFSKYEVGKSAKAGFNKNRQQAVHLQYVRLSYKQKDIIAGFIYEMESGSTAEKFFDGWSGGGNGEASDSLQELIIKITGEKKNMETPGGPPPVAAPKNN